MEDRGSTLSDRVSPLLGRIAELALETERNRRVSDEIVEALREAGMWRACVPSAYGGGEDSLSEILKCVRNISKACPSTGWVAAVLCTHPFIISLFTKRLQDEFWATGPDTLASSSILPNNIAQPVEGGLEVSGTFRFSSGAPHATWAIVGVMVAPSPEAGEHAQPTPCFCVVPRADYRIEDDWAAMGLAGTASCSLVLDDVFVPEHRVETCDAVFNRRTSGEGLHRGQLWNAGYSGVIRTVFTPVFLGIADAILEDVPRRIQHRTVPGRGVKDRSVPSAMRVAESILEMKACSLLWDDHIRHLENLAAAGVPPDDDLIAYGYGVAIYAQELATRTIDRLFAIAGGSSIHLNSPIQRMWRDAHAGRSHIGNGYDAAAQAFGQHVLGWSDGNPWGT